MDHPKIGGLSDGAFRLWVQGLAYCQKFLTDGLISELAVRGLNAFSPKRRTALVGAGLWDADDLGIHVHDYLEWNESREHVTAARTFAKDRMKKLRGKRSRELPANILPRDAERSVNVPSVVSGMSSGFEVTEEGAGETDSTIRGSAFGEWYEDAHQRFVGYGYMAVQKDFQTAVELCKKFNEKDLHEAAIVWFGMDDEFTRKGNRTIVKFATRISECLMKARQIA